MRATLALALIAPALAVDMGDDNCECTGDISLIPDGQQNKEIGYGSDCRPWDSQMSYCVVEEDNSDDGYKDGKEWCGQSWCYVDKNNCGDVYLDNGDLVDPQVQQSVIYPTVELYFSYNTCGNKDLYEGSGTTWVWSFGECEDRTPNDYYIVVDGSKSVLDTDQWDATKDVLITMLDNGLNKNLTDVTADRVGLIEFSGKRKHEDLDTVEVFNFETVREDAKTAIRNMDNLLGQTWTLLGLQVAVEAFKRDTAKQAPWEAATPPVPSPDRHKVLVLITDGRPKPRQFASAAPGDTAEPMCIEQMINTALPLCENGDPVSNSCRFPDCKDVNMATTDCCAGDQDPCTSGQSDAFVQSLADNDIEMAIIAVGDLENMKSLPKNCDPEGCDPRGQATCECDYDIYYFDCLIKKDYDPAEPPIPHRITAVSSFDNFFEYRDPTASKEGGTDGQICIDPKLLLPPAPPTSACTEIPEPKDVVIVLDSSKSMYTKRNRADTAAQNWIKVMEDLQAVICLYNSVADPSVHRCAFTTRDKVGLVRFATKKKIEWDFNYAGQWWSNIQFTLESGGEVTSAMNRKELKFMTDTVAGLWDAFDMMKGMEDSKVVLQNGEEIDKRREVILITDGRPHCKRDDVADCRPCGTPWKDETLKKASDANAEFKIVWRGDRQTHDGTISVDKDQLAQDDWFGCLDIDFDDAGDFVTVENFDEDDFLNIMRGRTVCVQDQSR